MIKSVYELTEGQIVYLDDTVYGILPYHVREINENYVAVHNADTGYDRHILEFEVEGVYESFEEAVVAIKDASDKNIAKLVSDYSANIPSFIEDMIQSAFYAAQDPDHGNYEESEAIKQVVQAHFSTIQL